ncbi:MAG: hypothetical protein QOD05_1428 [Microbacteriaceae bacterium]|jgi:hypothetical protein|nr:hypothetical protein [Microbacteriaceae bacterium]
MFVPIMRAWSAAMSSELASLPRPTDAPQAHSAGIDSDRVLVFGGGVAVGWGVLSHDLALPGSLARTLSFLTERGTDVDVVADPRTTITTARDDLEELKLSRYDAIVVTIGSQDARMLTSVRVWRRELAGVLRYLERESSRSTQIFVLGIHSIRLIPVFDSVLGALADRHARVLNRVTARMCSQMPRTTFVPFTAPPVLSPGRIQTAIDYNYWAQILAPRMAPRLDAERLVSEDHAGDSAPQGGEWPEQDRQRAVDGIGVLGEGAQTRVDRIVELARHTFGTRSAAFSICDNDRQWHVSSVGLDLKEVPRVSSFSTITILESGPMIVSDARTDERFRDNPLVHGESHIRFYAGFPVESASGERIGALCVFDPEPRPADEVDSGILRALALMVQRELGNAPSAV